MKYYYGIIITKIIPSPMLNIVDQQYKIVPTIY